MCVSTDGLMVEMLGLMDSKSWVRHPVVVTKKTSGLNWLLPSLSASQGSASNRPHTGNLLYK